MGLHDENNTVIVHSVTMTKKSEHKTKHTRKHYPKMTNKQEPNKTSYVGQKPEIKISKIGMASREYNVHHDFTENLVEIFRIFDTAKCDAILFSLYSIYARQGYSLNKHLERLKNIKLVMFESFHENNSEPINHAYFRDPKTNKWERYDYSQKFGSLSEMNDSKLYSFVESEIPQRIFGNSISLLCGETNIVKYSKEKKKIIDIFKLNAAIPDYVQIILNPIHDRMTRFEMKLKRQFLSENNRWVISVWNKGKKDKNGTIKNEKKPAWTVFYNGKEIEVKRLKHDLGPEIELGIVNTRCK